MGGPRTILGADAEMHRHEQDPLLAGKRILVADDEPTIRDTLKAILTQKGADVTICSTGGQTIDTLETTRHCDTQYDLIISDIKMPDRNGYEVFRCSKSINNTTPVILMTGFGYDPHHSIVRASQEGLQTFLFKPFKASQLMEVLNKVLSTPAR
jgi:CheY-like chemotaxis protein